MKKNEIVDASFNVLPSRMWEGLRKEHTPPPRPPPPRFDENIYRCYTKIYFLHIESVSETEKVMFDSTIKEQKRLTICKLYDFLISASYQFCFMVCFKYL